MTTDEKRFIWGLCVTLMGILILMALTWPAKATEPEQFSYRWYKRDLYYRNYFCGGRYRAEGCDEWRWRRRHRAYHQQPANSDGIICHGVIEATGDQAQSERNAFESALTAWKGRVRFRYGERYTEFRYARDSKKDCAPSSVADSGRDKALTQLYRCELSARPCRVQARKIGRGDD